MPARLAFLLTALMPTLAFSQVATAQNSPGTSTTSSFTNNAFAKPGPSGAPVPRTAAAPGAPGSMASPAAPQGGSSSFGNMNGGGNSSAATSRATASSSPGASMGMPYSGTAPKRNPMMPPSAVKKEPSATPPMPGVPLPNGTMQMPGMQAPGMLVPGLQLPPQGPSLGNIIKESGKRIGTLNGKGIFKQEDTYYFDTIPEKTKK
jgi:hypothetical protein